MWGVGCGVWGVGCGVWGVGFGVWGFYLSGETGFLFAYGVGCGVRNPVFSKNRVSICWEKPGFYLLAWCLKPT
ncbi:MAG: hypothetical protein F6J93_28435 [Oscillatoria sp. SIO1A7]|nr:hypothetical protein [Oscillatoria sp. SIO1A7]